MKASKFYLLSEVKDDVDFHRKQGRYNVRGVYFWGFTLNPNALLPENKDELVIYYIGKSERNLSERVMQEVTQLIFGGFGTIIDYKWLEKNFHKARIFEKQETLGDPDVLYKSDGLHVLYDFFNNSKIQPTLDWMRKRLIFSWIDDIKPDDLKKVESELHHIVRTNTLGIGKIKRLSPKKDVSNKNATPFFNSIIWNNNKMLEEWLSEVNKNIP